MERCKLLTFARFTHSAIAAALRLFGYTARKYPSPESASNFRLFSTGALGDWVISIGLRDLELGAILHKMSE